MKKGDFVRAWNGERPGSKKDYAYGLYCGFAEGQELHYLWNYGKLNYFRHAEPATTQPEWAEPRRRVIADRAKLCRVLLDMGYEPDDYGYFNNPYLQNDFDFSPAMWSLCGQDVEHTSPDYWYRVKHFRFHPEWTEEY